MMNVSGYYTNGAIFGQPEYSTDDPDAEVIDELLALGASTKYMNPYMCEATYCDYSTTAYDEASCYTTSSWDARTSLASSNGGGDECVWDALMAAYTAEASVNWRMPTYPITSDYCAEMMASPKRRKKLQLVLEDYEGVNENRTPSTPSQSPSAANGNTADAFPSQSSLTLEQVQFSGILDSIPKKPAGSLPNANEISDTCEICKNLINAGYDIRLGEAGRATLKREISRRLKESARLRDLCVTQVCRLKNANVLQLIQMSELTGCLLLALRISNAYWKDYNRKQSVATGGVSQTREIQISLQTAATALRRNSVPRPSLRMRHRRRVKSPQQEGEFPELEFSSSPSPSDSPSPHWVKGPQATDQDGPIIAVTPLMQSLADEEESKLSKTRRRSPTSRPRRRGRPRKTEEPSWKPAPRPRRKRIEASAFESTCLDQEKSLDQINSDLIAEPELPAEPEFKEEEVKLEPCLTSVSTTDSLGIEDAPVKCETVAEEDEEEDDVVVKRRRVGPAVSWRVVQRKVDLNCWRMTVNLATPIV